MGSVFKPYKSNEQLTETALEIINSRTTISYQEDSEPFKMRQVPFHFRLKNLRDDFCEQYEKLEPQSRS